MVLTLLVLAPSVALTAWGAERHVLAEHFTNTG
jgi:hypothetical protein